MKRTTVAVIAVGLLMLTAAQVLPQSFLKNWGGRDNYSWGRGHDVSINMTTGQKYYWADYPNLVGSRFFDANGYVKAAGNGGTDMRLMAFKGGTAGSTVTIGYEVPSSPDVVIKLAPHQSGDIDWTPGGAWIPTGVKPFFQKTGATELVVCRVQWCAVAGTG